MPVVHLRRHRQLRRPDRRDAGLRRHRPATRSAWIPRRVEAAITERTVGIMPVHLYGHPADMTATPGRWPTSTACRSSRTPPRPTARLSTGHPGRRVRRLRDVLALPDEEHDLRRGRHGLGRRPPRSSGCCGCYRNQGMERQYENEVVGFNNRMTDIHAAIGRVQLTKVDGWTKQRQDNAAFLLRASRAASTPRRVPRAQCTSTTSTPSASPRTATAWPTPCSEEYAVGSGMFYPVPNHRLPPFASGRRPARDRARGRECLSLPVHPSLSAGRPGTHRAPPSTRCQGGGLTMSRTSASASSASA